jgi:hypothetical protein
VHYVVQSDGPVHLVDVTRDPRAVFDRTTANVVLPASWLATQVNAKGGCDGTAMHATIMLALAGAAGAWPTSTLSSVSAALAQTVSPCGISEVETAKERALRKPSASIFADAAGGASFFRFLDVQYAREPDDYVRSLVGLGASKASNRPDAFDILQHQFPDRGSTEPYLNFAAYRFLCAHKDSDSGRGCQGRIEPDWDIPLPEKPRRLQSPQPVAPFGASYIMLHNPKHQAAIRLEWDWESYAWMRWLVIKLDADRHEQSRIVVNSQQRATEAVQSLVNLQGAEYILLVGAAFGDPTVPLYPPDAVPEGHGYMVTIAID